LPIATTGSPTWSFDESPSGSTVRFFTLLGSILRTARSLSASMPSTFAWIGLPFSSKLTVTLSAPWTTCALVRIVPSLSTTNPEPVAVPCCWPPNSDWSLVTPLAWT
jgi:hypothetical protein